MLSPTALDHRDLGAGSIPGTPGRFLWLFIRRRFPGRTALMVLSAAAAMGFMGLEPVAVRGLIDALTVAIGDVGGSVGGGDTGGVWPEAAVQWGLMLALAWLGSALFNRVNDAIDIYTEPALRFEVQATLFSYLLGHSPSFFQENQAGKLGQKVIQAGQAAVQLIHILCVELVRMVVVVTTGLVLLTPVQGIFALVMVGWTIGFLGLSVLMARRCLRLSHASSEETATVSGRIVDALANIELVRAFTRGGFERARLSEAFMAEFDRSRALRWYLLRMAFLQLNGTILFQLSLIVLAVNQLLAGQLTVGQLVLVFSLSFLVGMNVFNLSTRLIGFFEHLGLLSSALTLVAQPHEIADPPGAPSLKPTVGAIAIRDLRFAHADGTVVFDGLDLDIRGGEKVALVGPSGAGKSTLVRLLRRQFPPQAGLIAIDGQDVAAVSLASLNETVAEVPQDPGLFHRSVRENIGYAVPEVSDKAILEAARKAHCDDFIRRRPQGYDGIVGERGVRLSGGERQRVAIARAFLKDAPILVLDEATSSLDSETERLIQDALWQLFQGRTVIAIAHRLSTVTGMDRILFLDRGRIVEQGSHAGLLAMGGAYARLWHRQAGGFLP